MFKKFMTWLNKHKVALFIWVMILSVLYFGVKLQNKNEEDKIKTVSYDEFLKMAENGEVDYITYNVNSEWMIFSLYNEDTKGKTRDELEEMDYEYQNKDLRKTLYPAYEDFRKDMLSLGISMDAQRGSTVLANLLSSLITLCLPFLILVLVFNGMSKRMGGLEKDSLIQKSDVKFTDVIGQEEILDDIKFITSLIKDPKAGKEVGAKVPKGILLSGEPGTGKTLIAKAIAGEAGVPFLYMNASSFIEMYVGVGAKRVRELFKIAKENTPCVVFIDEIDAVGNKRDSRGTTSENDQTINALLQEMDGFSERSGVFVIAATNRPDKLDKALVRAGRFDRQIVVAPPKDWRVRMELFAFYLKDLKVSDDVDIETLSKQTVGFTGADIAAICNEAGIIAMMKEQEFVTNACIEEAIDKKVFKGNRSNDDNHKNDKKIVAYHEAGHAVVTYLVKKPIARATIVGTTSGVGGFVMQTESDSYFTTDEELRNQIMIAFGGRASEAIKFDNIVTTGASSDITQATNIMLNYIEKYGFDKDFGLLDMSVLKEQQLVDSRDITKRMSEMSKDIYNKTYNLLKNHYGLVEVLAERLLEEETISGSAIKELLDNEQKKGYLK